MKSKRKSAIIISPFSAITPSNCSSKKSCLLTFLLVTKSAISNFSS
nr:MAG TPA: hypothetical protein [Caudoviricetes sp.]